MKRMCPICKRMYTDYPAISRKDNKTEICPECGLNEALIDFFNYKCQSRDVNEEN